MAPVNGAGPTFVLSSLPSRIQEGATGGVKLVLNVTNAINPSIYNFVWTITDPGGVSRSSTNSTTSTTSSWLVFTNYPAAFGGTTDLVGYYKINVTETAHSGGASVAAGQFQVGLTDNSTYHRTQLVMIKASGYVPLDNVTINLTQGSTSVPNFPTTRRADTNGIVSLSWQTSIATPLGSYSLTLSGASTPAKTPPDLQQLTIYPTNITISGLWLSRGTVQRSQSLEFRFNATYLNGSQAASGSAPIRITESDGITTHTITASYDPALQTFRAFYVTTLGSNTGVWIGNIDINTFDDGLNNGGPLIPVFTSFNVQPASLTVSAVSYNSTYSSGTILPIYARITAPNAATFTQGTVSATITSSGRKIAGPLGLVYDPSRGEWSGSYKINATDPSGTWVITIAASDGYGNSGQNSASLSVNTTGVQNPAESVLTSWAFWLLVLALMVIGFGILMLRFRGVSHQEVKLDVQAIKHQADQVKGDDFLQSIQAQLKRRAERIATEKEAEKEKHD